MSVKQSLHQAIETLPESLTLEEAFERLYQLFKLKHRPAQGQRMAAILEELAQAGGTRAIDDPVTWQQELRADRPLPGREP